jgi:hypothetical protein
MMEQLGGVGGRPLPSHPVSFAAAIRWFLARSTEAGAKPPEILEYQGADSVLRYLEAEFPRLRPFLQRAESVASLAGGLELARRASVPPSVIAALEESVNEGLMELQQLRAAIDAMCPEDLLASYAQVADLAGVLDRDW